MRILERTSALLDAVGGRDEENRMARRPSNART